MGVTLELANCLTLMFGPQPDWRLAGAVVNLIECGGAEVGRNERDEPGLFAG